jgi:hypothetical protein
MDMNSLFGKKDADPKDAGAAAPVADEQAGKKEDKPAEKKSAKKVDVLDSLVLRQKGEVVKGEPVSDNYAVSFKKDADPGLDSRKVLAELQARYPRCVFTYFG